MTVSPGLDTAVADYDLASENRFVSRRGADK